MCHRGQAGKAGVRRVVFVRMCIILLTFLPDSNDRFFGIILGEEKAGGGGRNSNDDDFGIWRKIGGGEGGWFVRDEA